MTKLLRREKMKQLAIFLYLYNKIKYYLQAITSYWVITAKRVMENYNNLWQKITRYFYNTWLIWNWLYMIYTKFHHYTCILKVFDHTQIYATVFKIQYSAK